ncbi:hypothetical protein [Coralloluteibacterium thermophilus]|uniref:Uncharacterized protein n=1 Tax=Coralloluteibacterium thermophilum TaxID=2707049 RepID=A0ABV9NPV2_9GAMM
MSDTYSNERAGFRERLARMAGRTAWREPLQGHGTAGDTVPDEHALAASLAFARRHDGDIGPDIAFAMVTQSDYRRARIVSELTAALLAATGRVGERCRDYLPQVCGQAYIAVVLGREAQRPDGVSEHDWRFLVAIGEGVLLHAADSAIRRAAACYRAAA